MRISYLSRFICRLLLLDSYIKQQMMNNFSLVAFTQIRHFGSLIPNIFSIYKFVFHQPFCKSLCVNKNYAWMQKSNRRAARKN